MLKDLIRGAVPIDTLHRLRRISRLRWITKRGILKHYGVRISDDPWRGISYVLWDPEVESFTYEIENEDELAEFVSTLVEVELEQVRTFIDETRQDPELDRGLRRTTRWQFDVKRRLPIGNRLLWYALARALKPELIVETGIYQGLGSLVLLRALERNAREGVDGELISFDVDPRAGQVVAPRVSGRWQRIEGLTTDTLADALEGRRVGMMLQDTPHTYENQAFEFGTTMDHAADRIVLLDGGGGRTHALAEICERHGGVYRHFRERPRDHFFPASGSGVALIDRPPPAEGVTS